MVENDSWVGCVVLEWWPQGTILTYDCNRLCILVISHVLSLGYEWPPFDRGWSYAIIMTVWWWWWLTSVGRVVSLWLKRWLLRQCPEVTRPWMIGRWTEDESYAPFCFRLLWNVSCCCLFYRCVLLFCCLVSFCLLLSNSVVFWWEWHSFCYKSKRGGNL